MTSENHSRWMQAALESARHGLAVGELPIGAVVVLDDEIVGRAHTEERLQGRLLVHAELLALEQADRNLTARRRKARLYTTLEPCLGCLGAAMTVMVGTIVFGLESPSDGAIEFAKKWNLERDRNAFPAYQLPTIHGGVYRSESVNLFRKYVDQHPEGGIMVEWARTFTLPS